MTPTQINEAIAKAVGWTDDHAFPGMFYCEKDGTHHSEIPNYCEDLNAIHEAEKALKSRMEYERVLRRICLHLGVDYAEVISASASQRSEAFLRTLGLWTD